MQNAETILTVIRKQGARGLPLERIYRQLFNPDLYLLAYGRLARNHGALTPGTTTETVDGMSQAKIAAIIAALRQERYRWTPVRRVYIEKKHSTKKRPLGLPTWSDKLLQEVMRLILEAYFEPQFSEHSHGFRRDRGCHTALRDVYQHWHGTSWFIEGDISRCFDSLDHEVLLATLGEHIHDGRFLRLIENLLKAGYLENWRYNATLSGSPQGGVVSPILANIYLDRLDQFVETVLLPQYNHGTRARNPEYDRKAALARYYGQTGRIDQAALLRRELKQLPSILPNDPEYRRLRYVRYADDFLLGFNGPRAEAEAIKRQIGEFLRDTLKLELSAPKTLITPARSGAARFLGYDITILQRDDARDRHGRRAINGVVGFRVPVDVINEKCRRYLRSGKPIHLPERIHDSVYSTVVRYQQEFRGLVEYYRLAQNLRQLRRLQWVMETSLTKTLAAKLRISVKKVYGRYRTLQQIDGKLHRVVQVTVARTNGRPPLVGRWGGISLKRNIGAVLNDQPPQVWNVRTELEQRLLADECELCGSHDSVEVHHIRALKDLRRVGGREKPAWVQAMAARRRKTLVVCRTCHLDIQHGHPVRNVPNGPQDTGEPDDRKRSRPVRRGADGKGLLSGGTSLAAYPTT